MSESEQHLRGIADTARWVAIYRAMESERPDALFRDPHARRLGGERGEAIVRTLPKARQTAWPMIVRTAVMDEIILRTVGRDGARTVLNLAAGLDTRPYRLRVPSSLRWLHVDLPETIAYVRERLDGHVPVCSLDLVAADLTDESARRALLSRLATLPGPAMAVTEGLLIYLQPADVAALARALAEAPTIRWWLIDLAAPKLLKMLTRKWQPHLAAANAPFVFAPVEGTKFFETFGWREVEFRSIWDDAVRLGRGPRGAWLWGLMSRLMPRAKRDEMRRMSGIVLLERI